ncbi:hypothetical protein R3P38DRAFT_2810623 [Favolaschia claudopus]|uniref:Uncharacterized protein n=1 Tax=Favolaschia claudopus TaxID=2862362 RepID=A0AAV9ZAW3_9AGAR
MAELFLLAHPVPGACHPSHANGNSGASLFFLLHCSVSAFSTRTPPGLPAPSSPSLSLSPHSGSVSDPESCGWNARDSKRERSVDSRDGTDARWRSQKDPTAPRIGSDKAMGTKMKTSRTFEWPVGEQMELGGAGTTAVRAYIISHPSSSSSPQTRLSDLPADSFLDTTPSPHHTILFPTANPIPPSKSHDISGISPNAAQVRHADRLLASPHLDAAYTTLADAQVGGDEVVEARPGLVRSPITDQGQDQEKREPYDRQPTTDDGHRHNHLTSLSSTSPPPFRPMTTNDAEDTRFERIDGGGVSLPIIVRWRTRIRIRWRPTDRDAYANADAEEREAGAHSARVRSLILPYDDRPTTDPDTAAPHLPVNDDRRRQRGVRERGSERAAYRAGFVFVFALVNAKPDADVEESEARLHEELVYVWGKRKTMTNVDLPSSRSQMTRLPLVLRLAYPIESDLGASSRLMCTSSLRVSPFAFLFRLACIPGPHSQLSQTSQYHRSPVIRGAWAWCTRRRIHPAATPRHQQQLLRPSSKVSGSFLPISSPSPLRYYHSQSCSSRSSSPSLRLCTIPRTLLLLVKLASVVRPKLAYPGDPLRSSPLQHGRLLPERPPASTYAEYAIWLVGRAGRNSYWAWGGKALAFPARGGAEWEGRETVNMKRGERKMETK